MKVLLVGGGGREAALAWAFRRSPLLTDLACAPGNAGIARHARRVPIAPENVEALAAHAIAEHYDLVVVGPEAPLVSGLADRLRAAGLATFGPSAAAAMIEEQGVLEGSSWRGTGSRRRRSGSSKTLPRPPLPDVPGGRVSARRQGGWARRGEGRRHRARRRFGGGHGEAHAVGKRVRRRRTPDRRRGDAPGTRDVVFRARGRRHLGGARIVPGLQACRGWRSGTEHRRHGDVLAVRLAQRRDAGDASRDGRRPDRSRARRRRTTVSRRAFHRRHADGRRPEGSRVQRALRRPGDAGSGSASRGRLARAAARVRARRAGDDARRLERHGLGLRRDELGRLSGRLRERRSDRRESTTPRSWPM